MAEPLAVDPTGLSAAAAKLAGLVFPQPPAPIAVSGTDSVVAAINETMPSIESLVSDGLPGVKAALTRTASNMNAAADVYAKTDQSLGTSLSQYAFGSSGEGLAGVASVGGQPSQATQLLSTPVSQVTTQLGETAAELAPRVVATVPQLVQLAPHAVQMSQNASPIAQTISQTAQQAAQSAQGGSGPMPAQLASAEKPATEQAEPVHEVTNDDQGDYGFFWITAVTTDGSIVVANSYGLAYIPDGMELPNKVYLASADHAIPVDEIARCATYPVLAVQAWAAFHDMTLRAVIGTAEQLASSDPGVAKIVLEPDDIPESGKMTGRSRLEVVDPSAAAQLADTTDQRLLDLLPPAPVDVNPPGDERHMLWFELMKPMTSTATGREAAHLRAFRAYAAHSQEIALHQAHTATDAAVQRVAVADWLYWQYVTGLLDRALAAAC